MDGSDQWYGYVESQSSEVVSSGGSGGTQSLGEAK